MPTLSKESLFLALQENFAHARHQEALREKVVAVYWTAWGATVGFVYAKTGSFSDYPVLFVLLALVSLPVLLGTLKWSFEFGNHIAAISALSLVLHLNHLQTTGRNKKPNDSSLTVDDYLPFSEFRGYVALPLRTPLYLNVAVTLIGLECIGFALSSAIAAYGFTPDGIITLGTATITWTKAKSGICAFLISLSFSVVICWRGYVRFKRDVSLRLPMSDDVVQLHGESANNRINSD